MRAVSIFLQRVSLDELRERRDSSKSSILWPDLVVLSPKVDFLRKLGTFPEAKHGAWSASPSKLSKIGSLFPCMGLQREESTIVI